MDSYELNPVPFIESRCRVEELWTAEGITEFFYIFSRDQVG